MKIVYASEPLPKSGFSVFLAGPTPRSIDIKSWRPDMIKTLKEDGFKGNILVPENRDRNKKYHYIKHVNWEVSGLNLSNAILFWIPRELKTMPAFTTNIEFGEFMHSGKVVLGFPKWAEKMDYISHRAKTLDIPTAQDMKQVADFVINKEKIFLYACNVCYGTGNKESNGRFYKCSKCTGKGYFNNKKIQKNDKRS